MSQTETRFVTEDAYRRLRTKQDDDIRGEFRRQAGLIEKGNQQLRDELSSLSNTFDNELIQVKGDLQQLKDELISRQRSKTFGIYDSQLKHWGQKNHARNTDDSSSDESGSQSDSDDSSPQDLSFKDAVRNYPDVAIDELGSRLGLVLENIRSFSERAARHRQRHQQPAIKRPPVAVDGPDGEVVKRPRKSKVSPKYIPIRKPVSTPSAKSPSERLEWDVSANNEAHARAVAKLQAAQSHSTGSSKDSTTDVIPSQELRDLVSGKKRSNKES
ncbi:hypothetical protein B0J14DRAFT_566897 [Halenospora varia]|nr:hypothetical protein B0J14DRAFT_566897 [Halenospora varia]